MKTTHMAIALLLLVAVGCVRVSTTGGASSSRTGGLESPTVVRYHVAGFGAAKAGDYLAAPADIDKFFALGTNSVPGAGGSFDAPLATVFHRGRVFSLVSPTNVWAPFDLLVVENGRILMTVPDGACHLSFSVPDKCVEPDRKAPATVSLEQVLRLREKGKETDVPWLTGILASNLPPSQFHPFAATQALFRMDVEVVGDQPSLAGHFTREPRAQSLRTIADLPGTEKSLIEIAGTTGNGPPWVTPVVVKCRALTDGQAQVGHSGVNYVMQEFLQLEPIVGKEELRPGTGEVFRLHYDYLAPPQFKQRPIRKGEEVLWVIEQRAKMGDFSALKALADTQENRAAVQEVFGDLTLEKRRAVLLEALGERTPMGAELEYRLRWVLRDVRHFSVKFRRGAVPADTAGAERAADGRHYVRTAITLDRLAGGPVPENWVRQLTTHIAQGNRVEELEIRVADPVASAWAAMILAMQAGDKVALAKTCTEKGYQSVVKGFRNKEAGAKDLQSWGWAWSNLPLLSRRQTAAGVMLSMGSDVKTFGFEFVETPDGWKLDRWEQAK